MDHGPQTIGLPLADDLLGRRVRRVRPYHAADRSLDGVIVGFFSARNTAGVRDERTHVIVQYDDGQRSNCHPTVLRLVPRPPRFSSIEEADAWMERRALSEGPR